jgi:hypothetical protein
LRAVRAVANEAAQAEKFVIPQNMRVPESSVIRSLFETDGERNGASREDLGIWSDSKGKKLDGRAVAVEARRVADRVIAVHLVQVRLLSLTQTPFLLFGCIAHLPMQRLPQPIFLQDPLL